MVRDLQNPQAHPPPPPPPGRAARPRPRAPIRALDWSSGRPLNGRYRMLQKLGEGGMGAVFLCEDVLLRRKVALKTLFGDRHTVTDEDLERFRREVAIAHAVNHPNIARTYDLGEAAGVHYLTMEFLEGQTLVDRLRAAGPMSSREIRELAIPLCEGLRAAHRAGIVHRDLKPANVMLVPDHRKCVIMDFGIARAMDGPADHPQEQEVDFHNTAHFEVTSAGRGTPTYMAPEQWQGLGGDARTDIYALGVILYVSLTKKAPYKAANNQELAELHQHAPIPLVSALQPGVDRDLVELVRDCMAKEPGKRPQSMDEVLDRLQRGSRRRDLLLSVAGVTAAMALVLALVGLGLWTLGKHTVIREMQPAQARLAELVALQLDAGDLDHLHTEDDIKSSYFQRVHGVLQRYKERYPDIQGLYVMRPTGRPHHFEFVADLYPVDRDLNQNGQIDDEEKATPPGEIYDATDSPAMTAVGQGDKPLTDEDFTQDGYGVSLSGYAPVFKEGKRTKYFVGADARNAALERFKVQLVVLFGGAWLVFSAGFGVVRILGARRKA